MNERGSALLQVLITAIVAAIICASIIRTRLQPALTAAGAVQRVQNDASEQAALNRVSQVWMAGGSCSSDATAGVSCAGAGCACACKVTAASGAILGTVTAVPSGGACTLSVAAP